MFFRLLLLFATLPMVELLLLLWIKEQTSWAVTILLVLSTGVVGAALARWQGWRTVGRIRRELDQGRLPTDSLLDGLLILLAGVLLVTPGVLTDTVGFALLIPPSRALIRQTLKRRLRGRLVLRTPWPTNVDRTAEPNDGRDEIIDVRVIDTDQKNGPGRGDGRR